MAEQKTTLEALGSPVFVSRSSELYAWNENTLLKLFREGIDPELIQNEELNTKETYEKGISQVACYGHVQVGNRTGILIRRISGKTLISRAGGHPLSVFGVPRLMAKLQIKMHDTHTSKICCYKELVKKALETPALSFLTDAEQKLIFKKITALPDGDSILHLDYHPDNIMSDGYTTSIIDWMTAARGAPAADVAATLYLLNEGEMIPGLNKNVAAVLEKIRKSICSHYLAIYEKETGMTKEEIQPWRLPFLIVRLGIWHIESEVPVLQQKIREELNNG